MNNEKKSFLLKVSSQPCSHNRVCTVRLQLVLSAQTKARMISAHLENFVVRRVMNSDKLNLIHLIMMNRLDESKYT